MWQLRRRGRPPRGAGHVRRPDDLAARPSHLCIAAPQVSVKNANERGSCGFGLIASLDDAPSHTLVRTAIGSLIRLTHRGAIAADGKTGDGCGLQTASARTPRGGGRLRGFLRGRFAAGLVFLSPDPAQAATARAALAAQRAGLEGSPAGARCR